MKSILNTHTKQKITKLLKSKNVIFIGTDSLINSKNLLKINQSLKSTNYSFYRVKSNLLKQVLKYSIFYTYLPISLGPVILVESKTCDNLLFFKSLTSNFFAIKFNNKIYTSQQFSNFKNLNYINNVNSLYNSIDKSTKSFSITLSGLKLD